MENNQRTKRNIKPFRGDHYSIWKFRIKALIAEEGARQVLEDDPQETTENWKRLEMIAKGCVIEHLSDTMIGIVTEEETARDILKKLDAIYERKSLATQLAVQKKLLSYKLKGDTLLIEHFLKFDEMLIELTAAGGVINEMGKVAHLLLTLPSSYDGVVTAIQTLADENLTLAFVKTRLLDHETKLKQESSDTGTKILLAENSRNKSAPFNYRRNKSRKSQEKNKNQQSNKYYNNKRTNHSRRFKSKKCDHCGRYNHVKDDCYYYNRSQRTLQAVQTTHSSGESFAFMVKSNVCQDTSAKDEIFFILDSGASDHVVNKQHYFTTFSELENPIKISVAKKNTSITAVMKGNIDIITNLGFNGVLENVLYAPDLPYNLLSVRRMQQAGMTVIFLKKLALSQLQEVVRL